MTSHDHPLDVDLEVLAKSEECETCGGSGDRIVPHSQHPDHLIIDGPCTPCKGSGRVPSKLWRPWKPTTCPTCGGRRLVRTITPMDEGGIEMAARCTDCSAGLVVPQVGDVINWTAEKHSWRYADGSPPPWTCVEDCKLPDGHTHSVAVDRGGVATHCRHLRAVARSVVHRVAPIFGGEIDGIPRPHAYFRRWSPRHLDSFGIVGPTTHDDLLDGPWAELWVPGNVALQISTSTV